MPDPKSPQPPPEQPDEPQQWGRTKLIDGMRRRQCLRCGNWFSIEYHIFHKCPVRRQLRLFFALD